MPYRMIQSTPRFVRFTDGQRTVKAYRPLAPISHPRNAVIVEGYLVCDGCQGRQGWDTEWGFEPCEQCGGEGFVDMAARDHDSLIDAENRDADLTVRGQA